MALVETTTGEVPTHSPTPYQLMPGLTDEERASLRLDIEKNGIRVPIDVDEDDTILDGHHRAWIAAELGIPCPRRLVAGLTEEGKRAHAVSVNVFRRNLTKDQRRELVARLRNDGMTTRAIGSAVGVHHTTVINDLAAVGGNSPTEVTGSDGKTYKASKPSTKAKIDQAKANNPVPDTPPRNMPAEERAEQIRGFAAKGMIASQIAAEIGVSEERVRELARRFDIALYDLTVRGMKGIDPNRVVDVTVTDLEHSTSGLLDRLDGRYGELDPEQLDRWVSSLSESIRSLTTLKNNIKKELTHE